MQRRWLSIVALTGLCACAGGAEYEGGLPNADLALFQAEVYPVLLRDCAFSQCHGAEQRFFRVCGPGRTRLDPGTKPGDPATAAEIMLGYSRAVSMIASDADVMQSLLLTKPLALDAGGQGHGGIDLLGRNVYRSRQDPGYQRIANWTRSAVSGAGAGVLR